MCLQTHAIMPSHSDRQCFVPPSVGAASFARDILGLRDGSLLRLVPGLQMLSASKDPSVERRGRLRKQLSRSPRALSRQSRSHSHGGAPSSLSVPFRGQHLISMSVTGSGTVVEQRQKRVGCKIVQLFPRSVPLCHCSSGNCH